MGSLDLGTSDHHLIYAVFPFIKSKLKPKIIFIKEYKFIDVETLNHFGSSPKDFSEVLGQWSPWESSHEYY